jgi:hypothetical protein
VRDEAGRLDAVDFPARAPVVLLFSATALVIVQVRSNNDHTVLLTNGETSFQDYLHYIASQFIRELLAKSIKGYLVLFYKLHLPSLSSFSLLSPPLSLTLSAYSTSPPGKGLKLSPPIGNPIT